MYIFPFITDINEFFEIPPTLSLTLTSPYPLFIKFMKNLQFLFDTNKKYAEGVNLACVVPFLL